MPTTRPSATPISRARRGRSCCAFPTSWFRALQLRLHNQQNSALSPKLTELAILIAARHLTNSYEWNAHYTLAVKAGLSTDVIAAIADGRRPERMAEDEAILHDFCMELLQNKSVSDATYASGARQVRRGGCRRSRRPRGLLHVSRHGHERGAVAVASECDTEAHAVSETVEERGHPMTTRWTATSFVAVAFAVGYAGRRLRSQRSKVNRVPEAGSRRCRIRRRRPGRDRAL